MPRLGFLLSPDLKDRTEAAVQFVERMPKGKPVVRAHESQRTSCNVQRLRISSSLPVGTLHGVAYIPAFTLGWDTSTANWEPLFDDADAVIFTGTGAVDEGSGSGSGEASSTLVVGSEVWGRQVESVDLDESGTWPTFALIDIASDSPVGSTGGFFAWLASTPDEHAAFHSGCTGLVEDSFGMDILPGMYEAWNPDGVVCKPGYGWIEIAKVACDIEGGDHGWAPKGLGTNRGINCFRQAYHVYGRTDIPLIQPDGSKTIVFLRPTPGQPGLTGARMPQTYEFEYSLLPAGVECGSGGGGLFEDCTAIAPDVCWGIQMGDNFYPIVVKNQAGEIVAGG